MQLIIIFSGYLYNKTFVVLTAFVEFVWLRLCVCVGVCLSKNFEHKSEQCVRNNHVVVEISSLKECRNLPPKINKLVIALVPEL